MEYLQYIFRFFYRIRWWLIAAPLLIAGMVIYATRHMQRAYNVNMTIYTGVVSGYTMESGEMVNQNANVINNTLDNIINIMISKETLKDVCLHLYARHMIYGNLDKDNEYIQATNYRHLQQITPPEVKKLIDKTSEERTVENLKTYEKASPQNFVYGLFNWFHPHYSYSVLKNIQVKRIGNSDMLSVEYSANDPGVAYQTLLLLDSMYVKEYKMLQFGSTNSAIRYFEEELARAGKELRENEDSLTQYNVRNRIINYDEQTKQVAAMDRDFGLTYQDILLRYNNANASIKYLEGQMGENIKYLKGNAEFLARLNQISQLSTKVSEMESFNPDSIPSEVNRKRLENYKLQLNRAEKELNNFSEVFSNRKYTREGYPTYNFVSQWIAELVNWEKAKSELKVMESQKKGLDRQYSHFSPIGSTIKRQERSIDFMERNYLAFLGSLNAARLRLKSLEMNSASLKVINPPMFPLGAEPTKRKQIVLGAYAGSLIFLLGIFLLIELLDRTPSNPVRTRAITSGEVIGAFPGKLSLKRRKYRKIYQEKATQCLANTLLNYMDSGKPPVIINLLSMDKGCGKSFVAEELTNFWNSHGLHVENFCYGKDFIPLSKEYLFAGNVSNLQETKNADLLISEQASLSEYAVNSHLLQEADVNLLIVRADKVWKENDQRLFNELKKQVGNKPLYILLNHAERYVVAGFTGMLPPYTKLTQFLYTYGQFGLTSNRLK